MNILTESKPQEIRKKNFEISEEEFELTLAKKTYQEQSPTVKKDAKIDTRDNSMPVYHPICSAPNCDQYARTTGMCPRHYQQVRRYGRLTPELEYQSRGKQCAAKDCQELPVARGHCVRHYQQVRRYGRLTPERERDFDRMTSCQIPNCNGKHAARGYCKKHYMSEYYFKLQSLNIHGENE